MIHCKICFNDFTHDSSAKDKSRLPLQSSKCSHLLCYDCVLSLYHTSSPALGSSFLVSCPQCRSPEAYNPEDPIFSLAICELLQEREKMLQFLPEDAKHLFQQTDQGGIGKFTVLFCYNILRRTISGILSTKDRLTTKMLLLGACRHASSAAILLFGRVNYAANRAD